MLLLGAQVSRHRGVGQRTLASVSELPCRDDGFQLFLCNVGLTQDGFQGWAARRRALIGSGK